MCIGNSSNLSLLPHQEEAERHLGGQAVSLPVDRAAQQPESGEDDRGRGGTEVLVADLPDVTLASTLYCSKLSLIILQHVMRQFIISPCIVLLFISHPSDCIPENAPLSIASSCHVSPRMAPQECHPKNVYSYPVLT